MITFAYGSQSYFDQMLADGEIQPDSLYFINDTQRIYRGSEIIAQTSVRFVSSVPEANDIVPNTVYVVKNIQEDDTISMSIMVSEGTTLIPISTGGSGGNTSIDSGTLFSLIAKLTSTDVLEGKLSNPDEATDNKLITAGAVRQAFEWEHLK